MATHDHTESPTPEPLITTPAPVDLDTNLSSQEIAILVILFLGLFSLILPLPLFAIVGALGYMIILFSLSNTNRNTEVSQLYFLIGNISAGVIGIFALFRVATMEHILLM